jgi:DNA-binding response OmpR family regulator
MNLASFATSPKRCEDGYAVDTAEAGDDGLAKAEMYDYDVMLPRLDGWHVLERLRAKKRTPC